MWKERKMKRGDESRKGEEERRGGKRRGERRGEETRGEERKRTRIEVSAYWYSLESKVGREFFFSYPHFLCEMQNEVVF